MCRELKEMGIQVVVSVWPTVDIYSKASRDEEEVSGSLLARCTADDALRRK